MYKIAVLVLHGVECPALNPYVTFVHRERYAVITVRIIFVFLV